MSAATRSSGWHGLQSGWGAFHTVVITACAAALGYAFVTSPSEAWGGLLTAGMFGLTITLGATIFIALNVISGARWWDPIRRLAMAVALLLPIPAAMIAVALFAGSGSLYPWSQADTVAHSPVLELKSAWLQTPFFLARASVVLLVWMGIVGALRSRLAAHMCNPTAATQRRLGAAAALFLLLLAPTLSVASFDWTMSLEPEWFSTMYGVYLFSGAILAGLAMLSALLCAELPVFRSIPPSAKVRHDLGKLLFAFSAFWTYIWFSQYMLIWYANIPEEAAYFTLRESPAWLSLSWLNPVLNFVIPFVMLMPAGMKRRPRVLLHVSLVVLIGRWLDAYLMVMPPVAPGGAVPVAAVAATVAMLVLGVVLLPRAFARTVDTDLVDRPLEAPDVPGALPGT